LDLIRFSVLGFIGGSSEDAKIGWLNGQAGTAIGDIRAIRG